MKKKRIKFSNNLFGIIKTGRWINIEANMKIGIKKSNVMWRAYSRGNRSIDIPNNDYRIILIDANNNEIMEIKKNKSIEKVENELEELSKLLEISTV